VLRRQCRVAIVVGVTSFLPAMDARAQGFESEVRIDQLQPPSAGSPFGRAEGPHEVFDEGVAFAFRLTTDYQLEPVRSTVRGVSDEERALVQHALLGHLGASLSPLHWMMFELNFSFAPFVTGEDDDRLPQQKTLVAGEPGIGDIRAGVHFRPISGKELDLSLGARVWGPTGDDAAYMAGSDKFLRIEAVTAVAGEIDYLVYGCTLGLAPLFFAGRDGDRLATSCATHFKLAPMIALGVEPHFAMFSFSQATSTASSANAPGLGDADVAFQFEPLGTVAFKFGDFMLSLGAGPGIGNAPGMPKARAMLQFGWASRGERVVVEQEVDSDLDGLPDEYDACPDAAGPEERRGCPDERDLDGDGIIEGDACPNDPGASYDNPEANGCPDRDNDHIADPIDPCPAEPGPGSGGCPKFARLEKGDFVIDPPIAFGRGKTTLDGDSRTALTEVVGTMRANPKIKQISVAIGARRSNPRLTDKRAAEILSFFNDQNFDSSRFEVVLEDDLESGRVTIRVVK
jgi:outer membrane protein OmpA-like peptidoglycan-associated protein